MSFDGIVTRAIVHELNENLEGARINRIHHPSPMLLRLDVHGKSGSKKVLISASGNATFLRIAEEVPENPQTPSGFCMVLRKHLQNGRIERIWQEGMDRVIHFEIQSYNELGVAVSLRLTIELMGKHSNIFLLNEDGKIIEALKRVGKDLSRVRMVYPGLPYEPIASDKINVLESLPLPPTDESNPKISKWLLQTYEGFGPLLCRELAYRAGIDANLPVHSMTEEQILALRSELQSLQNRLLQHAYEPSLYEDDRSPAFYALSLGHLGSEAVRFDSMSACVEAYHKRSREASPHRQHESQLRQLLSHRLDRSQSKLAKMQTEYEESKDRDLELVYADLLSAHASQIPKGSPSVTVTNFFDEEQGEVTIPLDPKKNPWQNAQAYYKSYQKSKNREQILKEQLPIVQEEIRYLSQVIHDVSTVQTDQEISEIRSELAKLGYIKDRNTKKKAKSKESTPLVFESSDGTLIYVGKNNRQNDDLTLKTAGKEDWFFQAKDIPGSHVIVRTGAREISETAIREAAWLAAVYSSGKDEEFCLVDYTKKKNVRKPKGALPGTVYYDRYQTLQVDTKNPTSTPKERK